MRRPSQKIIPWKAVEQVADELRAQGKKIITTNGCFDLLHVGHLQYLGQARELGDRLWIGLNSDRSVQALKGPQRPIQDEKTRQLQLAALEAVDYITVFDDLTPVEFLKKVRPAIHVKGGDYRPEDMPETQVVEAGGGKIECLAFTPGYSTTSLIQKIQSLP